MGDYTSLGALGGLANLQAIAANLVSANLAQANPLLASSMDLLAANKQVHLPGDKRMCIAFLLKGWMPSFMAAFLCCCLGVSANSFADNRYL